MVSSIAPHAPRRQITIGVMNALLDRWAARDAAADALGREFGIGCSYVRRLVSRARREGDERAALRPPGRKIVLGTKTAAARAMRDDEGLPYREIAGRLWCAVSTGKVMVHRARKARRMEEMQHV